MNDHKEIEVERLPKCDISGCSADAQYDANTTLGGWANVCERHFKMYGKGLGLGRGQKLKIPINQNNIPAGFNSEGDYTGGLFR